MSAVGSLHEYRNRADDSPDRIRHLPDRKDFIAGDIDDAHIVVARHKRLCEDRQDVVDIDWVEPRPPLRPESHGLVRADERDQLGDKASPLAWCVWREESVYRCCVGAVPLVHKPLGRDLASRVGVGGSRRIVFAKRPLRSTIDRTRRREDE